MQPLLPIIKTALNRLQPPPKHAALPPLLPAPPPPPVSHTPLFLAERTGAETLSYFLSFIFLILASFYSIFLHLKLKLTSFGIGGRYLLSHEHF